MQQYCAQLSLPVPIIRYSSMLFNLQNEHEIKKLNSLNMSWALNYSIYGNF